MSDQQEQFKVGDVVRLKSGGPLMTVGQVHGVYAICNWFDSEESQKNEFALRQTTFPVFMLASEMPIGGQRTFIRRGGIGPVVPPANREAEPVAETEPADFGYQVEKAWLRQLKAAQIVGYCFIDAEGHRVERYDPGITLLKVLLDWQQKRVLKEFA